MEYNEEDFHDPTLARRRLAEAKVLREQTSFIWLLDKRGKNLTAPGSK